MIDVEATAAVAAPVVTGRGKPRLADRVPVREDVVRHVLRGGRRIDFAPAPARRDDVARVVEDDPVVHRREVRERRRRRHVVEDARAGGRAVDVFHVEGDLERACGAELAAGCGALSGADLTAAGG